MAVKKIFLDTEVYNRNPNFTDSVFTLIAAREIDGSSSNTHYFHGYKYVERPEDPMHFFKKREEETVLSFWDWFERTVLNSDKIIFLIGWNLINFDLPLLYSRLVDYGVPSYEAWFVLFHKTNIVDLRQVYLYLRDYKLKGSSLRDAAKELLDYEYNETGEDAKRYAEEGNWVALELHTLNDLNITRRLYYALRKKRRSEIYGP